MKTDHNLSMLVMSSIVAGLTAAGAWFSLPIGSVVPVTLQVFFVLLAGLLLGPRWGAFSQLTYLLLGGVGLPVFSLGGAGFSALIGPTGGYLFGFVAAAWVSGRVYLGHNDFWRCLVAASAGLLSIYIIGVVQLALVSGLTLPKAVMVGVIPFLGVDAGKALAAAWIVPILQSHLRRTGLRPWWRER